MSYLHFIKKKNPVREWIVEHSPQSLLQAKKKLSSLGLCVKLKPAEAYVVKYWTKYVHGV